jgi:hypothetical protein
VRVTTGEDTARDALERRLEELEESVRELTAIAADLRDELRHRAAPAYVGMDTQADWPDFEADEADVDPAPDWVASVPPPLAKPVVLPRLVLEAAFLVLVAVLAVLAELEPVVIAAVMAVAWALVAVFEWAAYAKLKRWRLEEIPPPVEQPPPPDPAWYEPPVERTVLQPPVAPDSATVVAVQPPDLPPPQDDGPDAALDETRA